MSADDAIDFTLLARYFAGESTREERALVDEWSASPENADEMLALRRLWHDAQTVPGSSRMDAMWTQLSHRMHAEDGVAAVAAPAPQRPQLHAPSRRSTPVIELHARPKFSVRQRVVAGLVAAALIPVMFVVARRSGNASDRAVAAASPMRTFSTARGQRSSLELTDGTRVQLGFGSTLRVASFTGGTRELYLEGEAMFDVVHDAKRPFIVHTALSHTEDLGTVFAVRAYPTDGVVRVTVASGRVMLRGGTADSTVGAGTTLQAGQLADLDSAGHVTVMASPSADVLRAWQAGRIRFDNARLRDVAADLERRYDVTIRIPATASDRRITVDMDAHSLTEVLDAIALPLNLRYRQTGGLVELETQRR
ncbi:MAG: FecR domain-containing protein [bacterium]